MELLNLFDPRTTLLVVAVMYAVILVAVMATLWRRCPAASLGLFCAGVLAMALSSLLLAMRGRWPDALTVVPTNALQFAAMLCFWLVLDRERSGRLAVRAGVVAWLMAVLVFAWAAATLPAPQRAAVSALLSVGCLGFLTVAALRLAPLPFGRSAWMIALPSVMLGGMMAWRALTLLAAPAAPGSVLPGPRSLSVTLLASVLYALLAGFGFVGLVLERWRLGEQAQRQRALEEQARAREIARVAEEQTRLATQRQQTVHLLAHEVRQPLHNAAAALQAARAALDPVAGGPDAAAGIASAQDVLRQVGATLDNTLAASALLASPAPPVRQDIDVAMLLALCLEDLAPAARARVRVDYAADARTAAMEPHLVRLALRNLLVNAARHAPPGSEIVLHVRDLDEPLAIVFEIVDRGPGLPAEMVAQLQAPATAEAGAPAELRARPDGHGLGLPIARRVAEHHGGTLSWRPAEGGGSVFALVLPQGEL